MDRRYGPYGSPDRIGPGMRASEKQPLNHRPTEYVPVGFRQAREAANMTVEEVAEACGYGVGAIRAIDAGDKPFPTTVISRAASVIPNHDLSQIREESND